MADAFDLDRVGLRHGPVGGLPVALCKQAKIQFLEDWGHGRGMLRNPPTDLPSLVGLKIRRERAVGLLLVLQWEYPPW